MTNIEPFLYKARVKNYKADFENSSRDNRNCNCIVLHDFDAKNVTPNHFKDWFYDMIEIFAKHNLEPTRFSARGGVYGHSVKSLTFKGGRRKIEKHGFDDIESISLVAMPKKDDYATNFIIDTDIYPDLTNHANSIITICIDEKLEPYSKGSFIDIAKRLYHYTKARYGYYYNRNIRHDASVYAWGCAGRYIDEEDERLCYLWTKKCHLPSSYSLGNLRDIYKLNFLSANHLNREVFDTTLQNWIALSEERGELNQIADGFWAWSLDDANIKTIRQELIPSGIILCV